MSRPTGAALTVPGELSFDANGLIPVVVQDHASGDILMLAFADRRALELTAQTGLLRGTSASGDPINNVFYQGGWTASPCSVDYPCTGTITLVPEPTTALLYACALATLTLLRRQARSRYGSVIRGIVLGGR